MIWLLYLFLLSLLVTNASATGMLTYISYQLYQTRQRVMSFFVGVVAIVFGLNLIVVLSSIFDYFN